MINPKKAHKWCWTATETKKGWRLRLDMGSRAYNLKGLLLADRKEVLSLVKSGPAVYVHLSDSKTVPKKASKGANSVTVSKKAA